jgi:hypothetical protein
MRQFLRLFTPEGASLERILTFATFWGPLYLCRCGCPITHPSGGAGHDEWGDRKYTYERLDDWVKFARQIHAAIDIAGTAVHSTKPKPGREEDWESLYEVIPDLRLYRESLVKYCRNNKKSLSWADRQMLLVGLNLWLWHAAVRPAVWWEPSGLEIRFASGPRGMGSLYGAILLQLVLAVARTAGVVYCAGCNELVFVNRRVAPNRRRYCSRCGKKMAQRDAARAYRGQVRSARVLAENGVSVSEIARRLDRRIEQIRRWVS